MGMVLSLILMLVYYLVFIGGTRIAANAQFSPLVGSWLANAGFAFLGIFLLARSDREHENRGLAMAAERQMVSSKLGSVRLTRTHVSRWAYSLTHHPKFFRVLDIYVLRGFWFFFALVLVVFVSLFIIVTLFELLPDIVKNNVPTAIVVSYFLFPLPQILYWVVPLTVLLAILINLGTLTKTNEILAVKAGAISLYRMSLPLLVWACMLSGAIYLLQDFHAAILEPAAGRISERHQRPRAANIPGSTAKWMAGSDNRIYHYNYFDPNLNLFGGISIFAFKPETFN